MVLSAAAGRFRPEPDISLDLETRLRDEHAVSDRLRETLAAVTATLSRERKEWAHLVEILSDRIDLLEQRRPDDAPLPIPLTLEEIVERDKARLASERPGCVESSGYKIYSQSDEDGLIEEIFRRIGVTDRRFVEIGVETGMENNTRLLLEQGWRGLWIEGVETYAGAIRWLFRDQLASGDLALIHAFVTAENADGLLSDAAFCGEIDLFSIDISGNDYHVWKSIEGIAPRLVILEHNSRCPPIDWVMPYDPAYQWNGQTEYYGASLSANVRLAGTKGYTLVAAGLYSGNGFYVRDDLVQDRFPGPHTAESHWRPLDYPMIRDYPVRAPEPTT